MREKAIELENRINRSGSGRKFCEVQESKYLEAFFDCLEMDNKNGLDARQCRQNAYLLSIYDVHTRRILKRLIFLFFL